MKRAIILTLTVSILGIVTVAAAVRSGPRNEVVIHLTAKKFDFSPAEIKVRKGDQVVLELTSLDREHGFYLPDFGVDAKMKAGGTTRVTFNPNRTGQFPFACDVFCGTGHEDMSGTLIVTD